MNTATEKTKKYKPYPEYKDSGVDWLGNVPEYWGVKKLKWLFSATGSGTTPSSSNESYYGEGIPWINTGDFNDGFINEISKSVTEKALSDHSALKAYPAGTLLVALYGATIGKLGILTKPCTINQACFAMGMPLGINTKFAFYWFLGNRDNIIAMSYGGGQPNISGDIIKNLRLTVPPTPEQQTIADFLDRRTDVIDELIAKKEQLIELLREKRTAIISHAVTKGLNPDAKMKDSGIDWLGEVPEHWEVKRLKRISKKIQTGCTPPTAQEYYYEDGTISWYGPGNFGDDLILGEASKLINESAIKNGVARLFEAGSTMIVAIGATIGKVGYIDKPASSNQQITAVAPNITKVFGKFLAYQLKRLEQVLKGIAPNTTLPIMDQQKIGCLVVATPPISEQQAIADFLDRETSRIDGLIAKVIEAIEKLKEYRTALISAAVTGKIMVF